MSRTPHIMMTTDAVGGVWVYAMALCRQLADAGHRVTLVTLGPPPQGFRHEEARALPSSIELVITDLHLEWLDPEGADIYRARRELLAIADRVRPDVVHINGYREGAFPWPCPSIAVAHSCVWSWWQAVHGGDPQEPRWLGYADAVRAALNQVNAWVALTKASRHSVQSIYQPETFGRVIHNGVDLRGEPEVKEPFILASGRIWDGGKNLSALAKIARDLPWPVYIAGAGMPQDASITPNVHWLGEIAHQELEGWMQRAAIYVAPAHYEPFGLGILEAARAGCALVLSDIDSLRELWEGAALHVPAANAERLCSSINALCANARTRRNLQRAAADRARRYSMSQTRDSYRELYEDVLSGAAKTKAVRATPEFAA